MIAAAGVEVRGRTQSIDWREPVRALMALGLVGTIVGSAWAYGGGYLSTRFHVCLAILVTAPLGGLLTIRRHDDRRQTNWIVVAAALVWIAGFAQTLPLPESFIDWIQPSATEVTREWLPEAIVSEASDIQPGQTLSIAATYTEMALAVPATFGSACWLASLVFSDRRWGRFFLASIAVAGGTFSFFGLADAIRLGRDEAVELRQRLIISPVGADDPFGPFVNNNNAAGFLNIAVGCTIGLLALNRRRLPTSPTLSAVRQNRSSDTGHAGATDYRRFIQVLLAITLLLNIAGVMGSASRGGFLGLMAGGLAIFALRLRTTPPARTMLIVAVLLAASVGLLEVLGLRAIFAARLETLYQGTAMEDPRIDHWSDSLNAIWHFLPLGAGLGTYRFAYLPFQHLGGPRWFVNADGMPIEWLLEGGLWLLPIIVGCIWWLVRRSGQLRSHLDLLGPKDANFADGMLTAARFVLPAMLVSQLFDYGILQPSLLLSVACIGGALIGIANRVANTRRLNDLPMDAVRPETTSQPIVSGNRRPQMPIGKADSAFLRAETRFAQPLALIMLFAGLSLATLALSRGSAIEKIRLQRDAYRNQSLLEFPDLEGKIAAAERVLLKQPEHSEAHLLMARLLIDQQRQIGASYLVANNLVPADKVASWVSPRTVRRAYYARASDPNNSLHDLLMPTQDISQWKRAREHAIAALYHCPLDDRPRLLLIELDMLSEQPQLTTPVLIQQVRILRNRTPRVMQHLDRLESIGIVPSPGTPDEMTE
ncbi:O-antigen ligase family protein [Rosistilla oblonga]|uniref:O-antigen ligase family protein n=1 Tax=Rosistilla oblonga TaxID=2527990 RepID=UPI003A984B7D